MRRDAPFQGAWRLRPLRPDAPWSIVVPRGGTYPESTVAYGVIGHYSAIVADFSPNVISIVVFLYLEVEVKLITIHRNSMYFNLSLQRKL